jgi:hypothetical protein
MITNKQLAQRIFDFFDTIYGTEKTTYGFSSDSNLAFFEDQQNDDVRPQVQTAIFYRLSPPQKIGNKVVSDVQIYNRETPKEEIITMRKFILTVNFLSKKKGQAKDAWEAFLAYSQSTRMQKACYSLPFPLVLVNYENPKDLTALEEGAWAERIEVDLIFNFNDKFVVGDIQFTQEPATVEDVKDIVQFTVNLKN